MLNESGSQPLSLSVLSENVLINLRFKIGQYNVDIDGMILPIPPLPADTLIPSLPRIIETEKDHVVGVLKVHPKATYFAFCDHEIELPILKIFKGFCLRFWRIIAFHFHGSQERSYSGTLLIQSHPNNALLIFGDDLLQLLQFGINRLSPDACPVFNPMQSIKEEFSVRLVFYRDKDGLDI